MRWRVCCLNACSIRVETVFYGISSLGLFSQRDQPVCVRHKRYPPLKYLLIHHVYLLIHSRLFTYSFAFETKRWRGWFAFLGFRQKAWIVGFSFTMQVNYASFVRLDHIRLDILRLDNLRLVRSHTLDHICFLGSSWKGGSLEKVRFLRFLCFVYLVVHSSTFSLDTISFFASFVNLFAWSSWFLRFVGFDSFAYSHCAFLNPW